MVYTKINSRWITDLNMKDLRENIRNLFKTLRVFLKTFLNREQNIMNAMEKIGILYYTNWSTLILKTSILKRQY